MRYALFIGLFICLLAISFAVNITACTNLSYAGSYILINDIINDTASCLTIGASNIILDCNNYTINSNTGWGIVSGTTSTKWSNLTIKNCHLMGNSGVNYPNCYTYSNGCYCGASYNNVIYNSTIDVSGTAVLTYCTSGLNVTNVNITSAGGWAINENMGSSGYSGSAPHLSDVYTNVRVNAESGGLYSRYTNAVVFNNSIINVNNGTGLYQAEHSAVALYNTTVNATTGGYSFLGSVLLRSSTIYISQYGFLSSNAGHATMYDSQIIARGTGIPELCDQVAWWPYSGITANNSNFTSINAPAIKNGNAVYDIRCPNSYNHSYIYSSNYTAVEEIGAVDDYHARYENTVIRSNGSGRTALYDQNPDGENFYINVTLMSNGGVDLQSRSTTNIYTNITFNSSVNSTKVTITNMSNAMNFTSADLVLVPPYPSDNHKHINVTSLTPFYVHFQIYYTNDSNNESLWVIAGWDGYTLEAVNDSTLNMTNDYVNGTISYSGIFSIFGSDGLNGSYDLNATCSYYGNCTSGDECSDNSDCESGICFDGHCIANDGCIGDGCAIIPNIIDVIVNILFGSPAMVNFMLALMILGIGTYAGFTFGGTTGALILDIILLVIIAFMPDPLLPWWISIICIIAAALSGLYMAGQKIQG